MGDISLSLRFERLMEEQEAAQMNALQLAYLGDSVWELIVRYDLIVQKLNVHNMHKNCVNLVCKININWSTAEGYGNYISAKFNNFIEELCLNLWQRNIFAVKAFAFKLFCKSAEE